MVNVNGRRGDKHEVQEAGIEGLNVLAEYAQKSEINILMENHSGFSTDPKWLCDIIKAVNNPYCNLNVDFGNFCAKGRDGECTEQYDPYEGVKLMMPYAKAISASSKEFDSEGMR